MHQIFVLSKKMVQQVAPYTCPVFKWIDYIYDIETKKQLSDVPYYFINIAEKFEFLDIENSQEISINEYFPQQKKRWIREPKDDDIVLLLQAKDNMMDLWHDPLLHNSLFFSDRLVQALFDAGFNQKQLGLSRCVIKQA